MISRLIVEKLLIKVSLYLNAVEILTMLTTLTEKLVSVRIL